MSNQNSIMERLGIHPKKEVVTAVAFLSLSFLASVIAPNLIAAKIGINKATAFCDAHNATCSQYHCCHQTVSLFENLSAKGYLEAGWWGSLSETIAVVMLLVLLITSKLICHPKSQGIENADETTPLYDVQNNKSSNYCCHLFKKFKDNVLPTKFDVYQLTMTTLFQIGANVFAAYSTADSYYEMICSHHSEKPCDHYFPHATTEQLQEVAQLAQDLYNTVMGSGIVLGGIISISIAIGTIAISAAIKQYLENRIDERVGELNLNNMDTDSDAVLAR